MWLAPVTQKVVGRWAIVIASLLVGIGFALVAQSAGLVTFVLAMLVVTMGTGVSDVLANAELVDLEAQSGRALMNLNHGIYTARDQLGPGRDHNGFAGDGRGIVPADACTQSGPGNGK